MDTTMDTYKDVSEGYHYDVIQESTEVDGVHVLAKISGPAFFPDTVSGNKIYYPQEAWEGAIADDDFVERMESKLVIGTIGHDLVMNDAAIRDSKFSHITTRVWIDPDSNIGMAEHLVLNTTPGQALNTLVRAGSKMRVSTKAKALTKPYDKVSGVKSIVPGKFLLERIDFVLTPGYKEAYPDLVESLKITTSEEELKMDPKDVNVKLIEVLESTLSGLQDQNSDKDSVISKFQSTVESLQTSMTANAEVLNAYVAVGSVEEVKESLSLLAQYQVLGTPEKIDEALDKSQSALEDVQEALESAPVAGDLIAAEESLSKYEDIGSVEEISEALEALTNLTGLVQGYRVTSIAAECSVDESVVTSLMSKGMALDDVAESISIIFGAKPEDTTELEDTTESTTDKYKQTDEAVKPVSKSLAAQTTSLASRLMG